MIVSKQRPCIQTHGSMTCAGFLFMCCTAATPGRTAARTGMSGREATARRRLFLQAT